MWLKEKVQHRNTIRFILAKETMEPVFFDKGCWSLPSILSQAMECGRQLFSAACEVSEELRDQLKVRFDRYAVLDTWNFGNHNAI